MLHSHWSPEANRFMEHEHLRSGPHDHALATRRYGTPILVVVKGPGNYSPHGLPENRDVPQDGEG